MLSLYSALSYNKNVVLEFTGQNASGIEETYEILKENSNKGGTAIIIDHWPDIKNYCTKFITVEVIDDKELRG